jgi:hypothetical protein
VKQLDHDDVSVDDVWGGEHVASDIVGGIMAAAAIRLAILSAVLDSLQSPLRMMVCHCAPAVPSGIRELQLCAHS